MSLNLGAARAADSRLVRLNSVRDMSRHCYIADKLSQTLEMQQEHNTLYYTEREPLLK